MTSYSVAKSARSRGLTVDLKNFSYGGMTPVYSTFESELKFDMNDDGLRPSSSDEDIIVYQDESDESDQELPPRHNATITPFHNNNNNSMNESVNTMHKTTSQSMVMTRQQSDSTSVVSTSGPIPRPRKARHRPKTTKFGHISSESFQHFLIRSITINTRNNSSFYDMEYSQPIEEHKHDKTLSTTVMNVIEEDDEQNDADADTPTHRSTGTTLINGHPPLPALDDTNTDIQTAHSSNGSIDSIKYVIVPKKKRSTKKKVGFAQDVVDPKRKYIEKEIIETEETYYRGLNSLLNELILPMFENNLIPQKYFEQCTSNLPDLLSFHDQFLTQLVQVYDDGKKTISQVFIAQNKEEFISLYLKYIRDYDNIMDLFGQFHKNNKLQIFLKEKRRERKPLTNFLILPVQRVPRYILLLTDLKKHTLPSDIDYKNIECALEMVHEIANEINERKRQIENMSQCLQIQEALSDLTESIVIPGRQYQKQFVFIKKSHNHQRQFFCFTDIIIVTNQNWRVKDILDIRTVDVKLKQKTVKQPLLKKGKSFRFGVHKNKENKQEYDTTVINMDEKNNENKSVFVEFVLLYSNSKPCVYVAKDMNEFLQFDGMVKENRFILIDTDLAKESDTSEIRQVLKEQGVTQSDDYQNEITSMKSVRRRGNASADKYVLKQSKSQIAYQ